MMWHIPKKEPDAMTDRLGQKLEAGDRVLYVEYIYNKLMLGTVVKVCKKIVKVKSDEKNWVSEPFSYNVVKLSKKPNS